MLYVLASNARTVHLRRARAVTITSTHAQLDPQLSNCVTAWFREHHTENKNVARSSGNDGDEHDVVNMRYQCLRTEEVKAIS